MKVLIIMFDGLEYTLVEKFNKTKLMQKQHGIIDLEPYFNGGGGVIEDDEKVAVTDEVCATIWTGKTPDEHGVKANRKIANPLIQKNIPHLFNTICNSLPIEVPMINQSFTREFHRKMLERYLMGKIPIELLELEYYKYVVNILDMASIVGYPDRNLSVTYFWFTDLLGHAYIDNEERLKGMYHECEVIYDDITKFIPKEAMLILVMSDGHGMLHGKHTDYGFWSANKEICSNPDRKIKITDWYNIIKGFIEDSHTNGATN